MALEPLRVSLLFTLFQANFELMRKYKALVYAKRISPKGSRTDPKTSRTTCQGTSIEHVVPQLSVRGATSSSL